MQTIDTLHTFLRIPAELWLTFLSSAYQEPSTSQKTAVIHLTYIQHMLALIRLNLAPHLFKHCPFTSTHRQSSFHSGCWFLIVLI